MRFILQIILLSTVVFAIPAPGPAQAAETSQSPTASSGAAGGTEAAAVGDFTSSVVNKFKTIAKSWEKTFQDLAQKIFWILAAIALFVKFAPIMAGGGSRDFGDFSRELVMFVLTTGVIFYLVKNGPELFIDLFNFFTQAAKNATGSKGDPQEIFGATCDLTKKVLQAMRLGHLEFDTAVSKMAADISATNPGPIGEILEQFGIFLLKLALGLMALMCCIVAMGFAGVIAIKYAIVLASGYLIAYAGIIILGFSGWGFTRDVIASYFKTAAGIGIQLMCYVLLISVGQALILDISNGIKVQSSILQISEFFIFVACMIMWYMMIDAVPPMVAGIAGAPTMQAPSIGSVAGAAAIVAAPLAAPLVAGAGAVAGGAATSKAVAAATGKKANIGQIAGGMIKGAGGALAGAMGSAVKTAAQGGSFGSIMMSAMSGASNYNSNLKTTTDSDIAKQSDEQKEAKRDEMQAQTLQAMQAIAGGGGGQGDGKGDGKDVNIKVDANAHADANSEADAKADINRASGSMNGSGPSANSGNNITADATQIAPEGGPAATPGTGAPAAPSSNGSFFQRLLHRGKGETAAAQRAAEEKFFHTNDNVQKPTDE